MKTFEEALIWFWAGFVLGVVFWACFRDSQAVLDYYAETGGDDLAIPPGPDLGEVSSPRSSPGQSPCEGG